MKALWLGCGGVWVVCGMHARFVAGHTSHTSASESDEECYRRTVCVCMFVCVNVCVFVCVCVWLACWLQFVAFEVEV